MALRTRTRGALIALALLLVVAGVVSLLIARGAQQEAPQPPAAEAGTYALNTAPSSSVPTSSSPTKSTGSTKSGTRAPTPSASVGKPKLPPLHGPQLAASKPTRLQIPAINVDDSLIDLGLNKDRTVQVPPLSAHSLPGWFKYSPTPGQLGPSVILGHIDSAKYGPGVFFKLGALRKGDTIDVTRADHTVAVFRVDAVAEYPKSHFPTTTVYGNTDHAALRLITCGGNFDSATRNYLDNIVAFASLVSSHKA